MLWAAVYLTWGVGLRPDWRSYRIALLVTISWTVVMFAVNHVAGTNYGFLNAKPTAKSLLDLLGPCTSYPWTRRTHSAGSAGLRTVELPR